MLYKWQTCHRHVRLTADMYPYIIVRYGNSYNKIQKKKKKKKMEGEGSLKCKICGGLNQFFPALCGIYSQSEIPRDVHLVGHKLLVIMLQSVIHKRWRLPKSPEMAARVSPEFL